MNRRSAKERAHARRFLARGAAAGAGLVEAAFLRHMTVENLDRESLAASLGCGVDGVDAMAACLLPDVDTFEQDTAAIAVLAGVAPTGLAPILRRYLLAEEALLASEPPGDYSAEQREDAGH